MIRLRPQALVAAVLLLLALALGIRSALKVRKSLAAEAVCEAVEAGELERALALTENVSGTDPYALRATECRCAALMESGRRGECIGLLEEVLARPTLGTWLPMSLLTAVLVEHRRDQGQLLEAADLAHRGASAHPQDPVLLLLELGLRRQLENESQVLREMSHRLEGAGPAASLLRLELAGVHLDRKDWVEALALLGEGPPPEAGLAGRWIQLRIFALAGQGELDSVLATVEMGTQWGLPELDLEALAAVALNVNHLEDPELPSHDRLRRTLETSDQLSDPGLAKLVHHRYIGSLVVRREHEAALASYDRATERFGDLYGLRREDLLQMQAQDELEAGPAGNAQGTVLFTLPDPEAGDELLLSPGPEAAVDSDYEVLPMPSTGGLVLERRLGGTPQRWVLRDGAARIRASGAVWLLPGREVEVAIEKRHSPAQPSPLPTPFEPRLAPADGRRRVLVAVLDCGDWRLVQYGRARGQLPVLEHLLQVGQRAVLSSDPPFTAVALQAIAAPTRQGVSSLADMIHQLGDEVAALNFVGRNPVAGLRWVLPQDQDIFTFLGSTDLVTLNLLRAYGPVQVGRNAQIQGPYGELRTTDTYRGSRQLTAEDRKRFPGLAGGPPHATKLLQEVAADFDVLFELAQDKTAIDLVVLRVAALDVFTHLAYSDVAGSGQDDGDRPLFWLYRYVDWRLGEVFSVLDEDDVLVVLSDHGIRTSFEHDRRAFFVAAGGQISTGRIAGEPAIRGLGRMLGDLLGSETPWPATGIETWVQDLPPVERAATLEAAGSRR